MKSIEIVLVLSLLALQTLGAQTGPKDFSFHKGNVTALGFSSDGKLLASGSKDGTVILWDLVNKVPLKKIQVNQEGVLALCFLDDGKYLLSGGWDRRVSRTSLDTGKTQPVFDVPFIVTSIAYRELTQEAAVGCGAFHLQDQFQMEELSLSYVYSFKEKKLKAMEPSLAIKASFMTGVFLPTGEPQFSHNRNPLLSGQYSFSSHENLFQWPTPSQGVIGVENSFDGIWKISATVNGINKTTSLETDNIPQCLGVDGTFRWALVGTDFARGPSRAMVFDLKTLGRLWIKDSLGAPVCACALSLKGDLAAVATSDLTMGEARGNRIIVWEVPTGKEVFQFQNGL